MKKKVGLGMIILGIILLSPLDELFIAHIIGFSISFNIALLFVLIGLALSYSKGGKKNV